MQPFFTVLLLAFFAAVACGGHALVLPNLADAAPVELAAALPYDTFINSLVPRQMNASNDCNATCAAFVAKKKQCNIPHCGCNIDYVQTQGECLVCQVNTPEEAADVQFLLDAEMIQCHSEGIKIDYQIPLPPAAAVLVEESHAQSEQIRRTQTAFLALQIAGGHIGLAALLLFGTFSRKIHRDSTFFSFCISWIFSSIAFSLLLYHGTEGHTFLNPLGKVQPETCLVQAALASGSQVMTACSTSALVIQLWLNLRATIYGDISRGHKRARWTSTMLLGTPYSLFLIFTLAALFIGQRHIIIEKTFLESALPSTFYCFVVRGSLLSTIYGTTLGLLLITLVFDWLVIRILYQNWWAFRNVNTKSSVSLSILVRVILFSVYRLVIAIAFVTVLCKPLTPRATQTSIGDIFAVVFGIPTWLDVLQAASPLVAFFVLGVNQDLIDAVMFWRK